MGKEKLRTVITKSFPILDTNSKEKSIVQIKVDIYFYYNPSVRPKQSALRSFHRLSIAKHYLLPV